MRRKPRVSNTDRKSAVTSTHARQHDVAAVSENGNRLIARKEEFYQGAIPHPEHFARFEEILPGSADRILALTEREQKAAHESNQADLNFRDKVLASTVAENNKKQNTAVLALSLCLLTSLGLAYQGADIAAGIVGGTTILGVVASFLGNKLSERSARVEQKNKAKDTAKR